MTPIDTRVRDAWNADDPLALHRAAEQLANEGNDDSAILDALERLLLDMRATGADDDTEERILGVMDRLTGWCHESGHIRTKRTALPTEEEIAKLPRWARVAFAARCARRIFPLLVLYGDAQREFTVETHGELIEAIEIAAAKAVAPMDLSQTEASLSSIAFWEGDPLESASGAVFIAFQGSRRFPHTDWLPGFLNHASKAARQFADLSVDIRRDFDHLTKFSSLHSWTDDTPVARDVFGPLWPEGPPKGWPSDPDAPTHTDIALEVVHRDGLDERVVEDEVVNLFNAMNRYHISRGGQPLSLEDFQPLISALVPAGV
jgi:hypothetical protein